MGTITVCERPETVSFEAIHRLLYAAHAANREAGLHVKTAELPADELEAQLGGDGRCFVALDGDEPVGVTAVRILERKRWYAKGRVADQIFVAVLPAYAGRQISSRLHDRVVAFARENGLGQIELRTASANAAMQRACAAWGFRRVDYAAFRGVDHYTVILHKWLDGCPYPAWETELRFALKKRLVRLRFKPGRVPRL
ncbi:MAG: GNAT family N-acetyltransferase [Oscillospiraceae bacterium]|nr:GNAT family N-acetyltransferase [Oscillospiraceae bacterium]